jgi:hypothetical protein
MWYEHDQRPLYVESSSDPDFPNSRKQAKKAEKHGHSPRGGVFQG